MLKEWRGVLQGKADFRDLLETCADSQCLLMSGTNSAAQLAGLDICGPVSKEATRRS